MAVFPQKPRTGQKVLQGLYNSVCQIIDYLPTLEIRGDNTTTSVSHTSIGTVVHANNNYSTLVGGKVYSAGSGLYLSGNVFSNALSGDGVTTVINNNVISCIVQGPTGDSDHLYKYDCPDCSLWFYSNDISNYPDIETNYVGINPGWLYGDAQCKAGFEAFQRALLLAMSGDYRNVVVATGLDPDNNVTGIKAIGSESVSTWWSQDYPYPSIWVNPNWLSGGTSCQAGYNAITATVNKYLTGLTGEGDTLKKTNTGLSWEQDNNDGGSGGDDYVFKYADPFNSIVFASNSGSVYNSEDEDEIGSNYIYVNDAWLAGDTPCKAGFMAIESAIIRAMSGDSTTTVVSNSDEDVKGIGSESVSTYMNEIWVNPAWLSGGTNCQAGYQGITGAVAKYLNSLTVAETGGNTLKKDGSNGFGWYKDNAGTGGDGDHVFKYVDPFDSLVFATNSGSNYTSIEENIGTNHVYVNAQWLAGNTECKAGFDAIQSAVYKYLTQSPTLSTFDSTSCTLKVNPTTNTLYWGEDLSGDSTPSTVFDLLEQGPNIQLTKLANGKTQISAAAGGSSPTPTPAGSGIPWPNYANLNNNGRSISIQQDYTVDSAGGWLRISYKGSATDNQCHSLMMNGNAIGMYTLNSMLGQIGNTWILPIPPFSRFMVNFPSDKTNAYFDGTLYDSGDVTTIYATIIADVEGASNACQYAEQKFNYAKSCADSASSDYQCIYNDPPNPYQPPWYWDLYYTARRYVTGYIDAQDSDYNESGSIHYAAEAAEYATLASTEATRMINAQEDVLNRANSYATEAANWATSASNWSAAASGAADDCYNWYLSACAWWNVTPHAKDYPNND